MTWLLRPVARSSWPVASSWSLRTGRERLRRPVREPARHAGPIGFPDLREPEEDERMHPATRLARALSRASETALRSHVERLVTVIDVFDEYDRR